MVSILIFLIVIALIFSSINILINKYQSRIYIPAGIEYLFLGILIGPAFSNWYSSVLGIKFPFILSDSIQVDLKIILMLLLGVAGFLYGLDFQFQSIKSCSKDSILYVIIEFILSFFIIGGISFLILYNFFYDENNFSEILTFSYLLSISGLMSSKFILNKLSSKFTFNGNHIFQIKQITFLNLNLSLALYGIAFGVAQISSFNHIDINSYKWIFLGIGLLILLGILFYLFLGKSDDEIKLFIAACGIISLTTGISMSLNFSVLYMNFLLGVIIINTSKVGLTLRKSLEQYSNILIIAILFFAGYYWMPSEFIYFVLGSVFFLIFRIIIKFLAGKVFHVLSYNSENYLEGIGKAFMPIEFISAALILDYINSFSGNLNPMLMSIVFISIIYWGIFGFNSVKNFLIDKSELKEE